MSFSIVALVLERIVYLDISPNTFYVTIEDNVIFNLVFQTFSKTFINLEYSTKLWDTAFTDPAMSLLDLLNN
jgi:hypothetical protein